MTYSIVAYDADEQAWGVAVQSKFLAVGAVVPWARAGVGAIATQALANIGYGPRGLEMLAGGASAPAVLARLLADDEARAHRQVGIVDAQGNAVAHTGGACMPWAGHLSGPGFTCQGNILVDERTVRALAETYVKADGDLAARLVAALAAAQKAGGDRRGQQSAALLVVKPQGGYGGFTDRWIDLRVDDAPRPIARLRDLLDLHRLYFDKAPEGDLLALDAKLTRELQLLLKRAGLRTGRATGEYDAATRAALEQVFGIENLEERWRTDARIDPVALEFLRKRFAARGK